MTLLPQSARLKRAMVAAVDLCGGIDGVAALLNKSRSLAGSWRNINQPDMPKVEDALAMDSVAVAQGQEPAIVSAMAREPGGVFLPLQASDPSTEALPGHVMKLAVEFGDLSRSVTEALADGTVCGKDATRIEQDLNDLISIAVRARASVQQMQERA